MSRTIGIDLGTTNSCVSVVEGGQAVIIPNDTGDRTTPSVVAFTKDGERLVGSAAAHQAVINPNRTISSVKRRMGTDWRASIDGKDWTPQEISAMILKKLKTDAEAYLGGTVRDAVITVPAYFNNIQRQATKDAGTIAGLNVIRIINEPTSAALAYGLNKGQAQKVMVYDLGGGTFDVSIIEIGESVIEVLATSGDNHLGGDDFDDRIVQWIVKEARSRQNLDLAGDLTALSRIREAAEHAKKDLSYMESTLISLPYITVRNNEPRHLELTLTRREFDDMTRDLITRTEGPVKNALNDAGIAPSELDRVLLVGGSTRIPAVQAKVKALTGKEPSKSINPDECVAQGAAIQGDTLSGNILITRNSVLLLDVTPLSLAIETVGGVATRVVERNSTLPLHYSQVFTTAAPFQSSVDIHVLQGERPMAADNKTIGRFRLRNIKRAPAGVPQIVVSFDIDTNGILKVSAKDRDTGREQSITITSDQRMTDEEIARAVRDAEEYASQDKTRTDAIAAVRDAQALIDTVQRDLDSRLKDLPKDKKKEIKRETDTLRKLASQRQAAKMTEKDVAAVKDQMERLRNAAGIV